MARVKAATLILDYGLYPRHDLNPIHIRDIIQAMESGKEMPPVIADRETKKITDGFHRVTAALRIDENATITVEWRDYADDAARFEDAMRLNASHGQKFSPYDHARCVIIGEEFSLTPDRIAAALNMTRDKLEDLRMRKTASGPDSHLQPIKHTVVHLAGRKLSEQQIEGLAHTGGKSQTYYVNQVINFLEGDLLDRENEKLMERLAKLARLLENTVGVTA